MGIVDIYAVAGDGVGDWQSHQATEGRECCLFLSDAFVEAFLVMIAPQLALGEYTELKGNAWYSVKR